MEEIEILGKLQRIAVKPGDVFVLLVPYSLSNTQRAQLATYCRSKLKDIEILILDNGITVSLMGNENDSTSKPA